MRPGARELEMLGYDPAQRKVYMLEHVLDGSDRLPQLYAIRTHGWLAGRTNPVHGWYTGDGNDVTGRFTERREQLKRRLSPLFAVGDDHFRMNTRVAKRRAVRMAPDAMPVRKYDLRVTVRPVAKGKVIPMGARKTVTAYLRPRARLVQVWAHPGLEYAVAIVSYVGLPFDIGYDKQTAIYVPLYQSRR